MMVESTLGMKSLYFEEANCTVLASYFHIRKGFIDQSTPERLNGYVLTPIRELWTKNRQTGNTVERHLTIPSDVVLVALCYSNGLG